MASSLGLSLGTLLFEQSRLASSSSAAITKPLSASSILPSPLHSNSCPLGSSSKPNAFTRRASSPSSPSPPLHHTFIVYVASMPLRLPPGPAQWAFSAADLLGFQELQHFFTILQAAPGGPCIVFDFQPSNPEDLSVAFTALSGGSIPGVVLERELSRLPTRRCWRVGKTIAGIGIKDAIEFNRQWDTQLQLWKHDCRHHTEAFVEFLTGNKQILLQLKDMPSS